MTDREPCDALILIAVDDVHARQIIADDRLPFLIGQYALAGLDGERAVPHALPAMLAFGVVLASHVGRERIVLAFPDAVASVEPAAYPCIRRRRPAIHVKRGKHVAARAHEMLVGVFIAPSLAEQVAWIGNGVLDCSWRVFPCLVNSMGLMYPRVEWSRWWLYHHTYRLTSERSCSTLVYVLAYMSSFLISRSVDSTTALS